MTVISYILLLILARGLELFSVPFQIVRHFFSRLIESRRLAFINNTEMSEILLVFW